MQLALLLILALAVGAQASDTLTAFGLPWRVPLGTDWNVEAPPAGNVLRLLVARPQSQQPRRPFQFALADLPESKAVTLEADVKPGRSSLILVYAYKDPSHFNYAHLSVDTALKQPVHNGIFHVFGGDRVRISPVEGPASFPPNPQWTKVRLDYDATTGLVEVSINGAKNPSLRAIDLSLGPGTVGLGSFFETADFRNVRITSR